jgi:predicted dehydrogenase
MFNQRLNPLYRRARELVRSGSLGELKRMVWIVTNWYRTQRYYDSNAWRATWKGEGGGVLMNQAPHNLDIWQWICGMPKTVRAVCSVGKYHSVEVEDEAAIYAEYENGATAIFLTSTGEYPGTNRLEISGTHGKLVIEEGKLTLLKLPSSEREICFASEEIFPRIEIERSIFEPAEKDLAHNGILENFANAILYGEELIAPGYEGIHEAHLANAAYYSAWHNTDITLPLDEDLYYGELCTRIDASHEKKHIKGNSSEPASLRWQVNW